MLIQGRTLAGVLSPSSRRAWVEIITFTSFKRFSWSPSSRRAWVEINLLWKKLWKNAVALLAEGVGRNTDAYETAVAYVSRPPRGGRG